MKRRTPKRASPNGIRRAAKARRARRRGPVRRWLRKWWWIWATSLLLLLSMVAAAVYLYTTIPLPPERVLAQTTFLYDRKGNRLTAFEAPEDRTIVSLERIPDQVEQAVLAAEDARFYSHPGISVLDIIRAGWADLTGGRITQGASTVTQQLVRSSLYKGVGTERTITRKVKEAILALKLERELEKHEILERYLNTIYLGDGAYGVQAASRHYFGKPVQDIGVLEAATLAGIVARPEAYNPRRNPEASKGRRNWVLGRMAELGQITSTQARELSQKDVEVRSPDENFARHPTAWFVDYARQWLLHPKVSPLEKPEDASMDAVRARLEEQTFEGGLRIRTTVDRKWQKAAITAIQNHYSYPGAPDIALVAIDPRNGAVRAMASSLRYSANPKKRTFHPGTFGCDLHRGCGRKIRNREGKRVNQPATGRQTGSAFKMFTLAAAVKDGVSLRSVFSGRSPISLDEPPCGSPADPYEPQNFGGSSFGVMDLFGATSSSVNTIFTQLIDVVGPEKVVEMAHDLGIRSRVKPFCSITLGAVEVNVLEMTSSFATLASGGVRYRPAPVQRIETADGEVLWRIKDNRGKRVLEKNEAWQVVDALEGVVSGGTGSAAYFGVPAFGKTGSEDDSTDAWFCGGTTELVACVWVGRHQGQIPIPGITGGGNAAPVWHDFMVVAHQSLTAGSFPTPYLTGEIVKGKVALPPPPEPEKKKKKEKPKQQEEVVEEPPTPTPSPSPTGP